MTEAELKPCQQKVLENIQRLWGTESSTWTDSDKKFDLNNDNQINIQDGVLFGQMTEKQCCNLLEKGDNMLLYVLVFVFAFIMFKGG